MRKNSHNPRKKLLLLLVPIVCVIVGALLAIALQRHHPKKVSSSSQINSHVTPAESSSKGSTPNTSYTPPVINSGITITPRTSGDQVVVVTKLMGYSDGTCSLTVTNGTRVNSQKADVIYAPNYSTCAGFTVPINELGNGDWNIELSIVSGGQTTSKTITYGVTP